MAFLFITTIKRRRNRADNVSWHHFGRPGTQTAETQHVGVGGTAAKEDTLKFFYTCYYNQQSFLHVEINKV